MTLVFIVFISVCGILIVLAAVGLSKPSVVEIRQSIKIKSTPDEIFPHLADFEKFILWSPWTENDPNMSMTFSGDTGEVDHCYAWKGNRKVGEGWMKITKTHRYKHIDIDLKFGRRKVSQTGFVLLEDGDETLVTWFLITDIGQNPLIKLMGNVMKKYIHNDFNKGLNKLKNILEA